MRACRALALISFAAAVAGCAPVDPGFGEAFRWNMAKQTINPDPVYDRDGRPVEGGSGDRAVGAMDRYEKGAVTEPATIKTTAGGSAGPR